MKKYGVEEMGKMNRRNKGITLMALVITVIVLLILSGITIATLSGKNGIINQSLNAKDSAAVKSEMRIVEVASNSARGKNKNGIIEEQKLKNELATTAGKDKTSVENCFNGSYFLITFLDTNRVYKVDNEDDFKYLGATTDELNSGVLNANPRRDKIPKRNRTIEISIRTIRDIEDDDRIEIRYGWVKSRTEKPETLEELDDLHFKEENHKIKYDSVNSNDLENGKWYLYVEANVNDGELISDYFGDYIVGDSIEDDEDIFMIAYVLNGGTNNESNPSSYTSESEDITLLDATRTGYTFTGWTGNGTTTPTKNLVLPKGSSGHKQFTANWEANTYTIAFNKNSESATGEMADLEMTYGVEKNLTQNTFTRTGYEFGGWNTKADGSGTSYTDGQSVLNLENGWKKVKTLYAQWSTSTYTIAYAGMDGATHGTNHPTSGTYNADVQISNPTKTGYTFAGWTSSSSSGLGTNAKVGTTANPSTAWTGTATTNTYFKNLIDTNNGTVTLTATWMANTYTITLNKASGSGGTSTIYETYGSKYSLTSGGNAMTTSANPVTVPTRSEYEFQGYYTEQNGGGTQYISKTGYLTSSASTTNFTANGTLYAYWKRPVYEITLDNQEATTAGTTKIYLTYSTRYSLTADGNEMTTSANPITIPTKDGYAFKGYYNTSAATGGTQYINATGYITSSASLTGFTENGTLYARWEEITLKKSEASVSSTTAKFLYTTIERRKIKSITFANSIAGHTVDGSTCFDVSSVANTGAVLLWITNTDENGYVDIVIGQNGGVKANPDSSYLFSYVGYTPSSFTINFTNYINTSNVTNMSHMFQYCGYKGMTSLNLGNNFDTSSVTDMTYMFQDCGYKGMTSLNLGNNFDTSNVTDMTNMFQYCGYTAMTSLDLGDKFDTSKVTDMKYMFNGCGYTAMTSLDLGDKFDTSKVTEMKYMFYGCGYTAMTSLDLGDKFNTSSVTDMSYMFNRCGHTAMTSLNLGTHFDTSNVINMTGMFQYCGYTAMTSLNLGTYFDTSNVTNMASMFQYCGYTAMTSLNLGTHFDTSNVINMTGMFQYCGYTAMTSLDLGDKFDTSNVTTMNNMFSGCGYSKMTSLDLGDNFDTSKVTNMSSMFDSCGYTQMTSLDLGDNFDTSNVTKMSSMFYRCNALTSLDLGNKFDTSRVTTMSSMFGSCSNLVTIYATDSFVTTSVTSGSNMFTGDTNLVGGMGTTFDSNHIDQAYAHLDLGTTDPGYFTDKRTYYVEFDANGGTGTMPRQVMTYGESSNLDANAFTKSGYGFAGWNTKADGSGTSYTNGQSVLNLENGWKKVKKLYAQWTAPNYLNTNTSTYYSTLASALSAVNNGQTIKALIGITETTAPSLAAGKTNVTIDLNGKTTRLNGVTLTNAGTLTITGAGTFTTSSNVDLITNSGTLTLNHTGTISSTSSNAYHVVKNTGTLNVTGTGTVTSSATLETLKGGNINISNGLVKTTAGAVVSTAGTFNMTGGTIRSEYGMCVAIDDNGTATISGGIIERQQMTSGNWVFAAGLGLTGSASATLSGGTIRLYEGNGSNVLINAGSGTLTIDGATVQNLGNSTVASNSGSGKLIVTSGTLTSNGSNVIEQEENSTGTVEIRGGTLSTTTTNNNLYVIDNNGEGSNVIVTGGTLTTNAQTAIHTTSTGTVTIGTAGSTSTTSPAITGGILGETTNVGDIIVHSGKITAASIANLYSEAIRSKGNITINGGNISATTSYAAITDGASTLLKITGGTITSSGDLTVTTTNVAGGNIQITGGTITNTKTSGVARAVNNCMGTTTITGGTIASTNGEGVYFTTGSVTIGTAGSTSTTSPSITGRILGEATTAGNIVVNSGKITATSSEAIRSNGNITINGGDISATSSYAAITDGASTLLKITGGTITSSGYHTVTTTDAVGGNIQITGGTITNTNTTGIARAINNHKGITTITGGTIVSTNGVGVYSTTGTVTLGQNEATPSVSTTSPSITGATYGVQVTTGTFNFYDGSITGPINNSMSKQPTDKPSGYVVVTTTANNKDTSVLGPGAPTVTAKYTNASGETYTSGTWTNKNVYVTLTDNNVGAGITQYYWKEGESGSWNTSSINMDGNSATITFSATRNNTIYFKAKDSNGITSTESSIVIRIERTAPEVTITRTDYDTFSWAASDNAVVAGYAITNSSTAPTSWTTSGTVTSGTKDISAANTWYVWVKDEAGNTNSANIVSYAVTTTIGTGTTLTVKEGNTTITNASGTKNVLNGTVVTITGATIPGYNTLVLKKGSTTISEGEQTISANTTFTSSATANSYTIAFNKNNPNASGTMSNITATNGVSLTLPTCAYTVPSGVTTKQIFNGWNTKADGSGTPYSAGATVNSLSTAGETVTLYAQWIDALYEVIAPSKYTLTMQEAIAAANANTTIKVLRNGTDDYAANVNKTLTLDLNNKTLTRLEQITVSQGNFNVLGTGGTGKDGTLYSKGKGIYNIGSSSSVTISNYATIKCNDRAIEFKSDGRSFSGSLNIENSWIYTTVKANAIVIGSANSVTINNSWVYMPYGSACTIVVNYELSQMTIKGASRIGSGWLDDSNHSTLIYFGSGSNGTTIYIQNKSIIMSGQYNYAAITLDRTATLEVKDEAEIYALRNNINTKCINCKKTGCTISIDTYGWVYSRGTYVISSNSNSPVSLLKGTYVAASQKMVDYTRDYDTLGGTHPHQFYYMKVYNDIALSDGFDLYEFGRGWVKVGNTYTYDWRFFWSNNTLARGLNTIGNGIYYFNENGVMQTGWRPINNYWYCFKAKTGTSGGEAYTGGPHIIDGKKYIFDNDGKMLTGWAYGSDGYWYYLNPTETSSYKLGEALKGWHYIEGEWYCMNADHRMLTGGPHIIDGKKYIFGSDGKMLTGWAKDSDGYWYYLNPAESTSSIKKGEALKGWHKIDGAWYCMNADYHMLTGGPHLLDGNKFIFASNGKMLTGWQQAGGKWYYLNSEGKAITGWYYDNSYKDWYYFETSGSNWGQMLANTTRDIDGTTYQFAADGHWIQ